LRCHPWCSRHGGHLYNSLNKAFVHVVLSKDELIEMGHEVETVAKVIYPQGTYNDAIRLAGLKVNSQDIIRTSAEGFFNKGLINDRIIGHFPNEKGFPKYQVEQDFLDYIVSH
jgi:hypothetical protein